MLFANTNLYSMQEDDIKGLYTHYKDGEYEVLGLGVFESTEEKCVIYKMLYDTPDYPRGTVWIRPESDFFAEVEVDGVKRQRFEKK